MVIRATDVKINLDPNLKPTKTIDASTPIKQPVPTSVTGASVLETQIGQTIVRTNLNEILDNLDSFTAEIKHSIKDAKLLTEDFKYSNTYENRLREYSGRSYSNIANRIDNSSSLQTDLFMAAIWEQRHQPELKEKLIDTGLKLSDIEKYLDKKLTMCIDEQWLQGRADYIKAFLDDKSGAKAVNELLVEKHSNNNWLLYSASDHYFISESRDILGREVHKSFDQTKDVIELLLNHDAISKKNQQKLSQTLCKTFIEKALSGDMLWNSHSKEYLQEQRSFRDHMITEVAQNSLSIQGLPINFIKTLNSEDFLSKFIYLKKEDGQLKFSDPDRISEYSLVMLKSQEKHLDPDIREAVNSLIGSEDFLNSRAASSYLYAALQLGNDKLVNEFIEKLELKHLEKNELAPYHIAWSLLEANLTQENTEKILSFAKSDQLVNNHKHYCNGITFAEGLFKNIISIDCVDQDTHKTKGAKYAKIFFEALDPQKISGAEVASTAAWHNHWNKDSEVKSSLEALITSLNQCNLDTEAISDFILQVLEKDYTEVLSHGTLNQIFALNQSIQSLNMSENFPDLKKEMEAYITHSKPELKVSLEDIQSTHSGRIISNNWDFSFLDKVIDCFDKASPAVTLLKTQREHAELMKSSLEEIDSKGLKINQAEGLQDTQKNNEALKVLGEAFIQADTLVPHKYLPALYLMEGTNPKFTEKIEDLYNKSNVVRQAGFIAKLHKLSSNNEKDNIKIENLETKLIQDCKNSEHLNLMLISLNQEADFSYSPKFIKTLHEKINQTDFIWNISDDQQKNFKQQLGAGSIPDSIKTKLDLVIQAHELGLNNKELVNKLEASLINECTNAHDLNKVLLTLNGNKDFKYSAAFRENLLAKIYRDENFTWNTESHQIQQFRESLPPLFNKLLMDTMPTIEGLKIENLNTCPAALELRAEDDGTITLHMLKNSKQIEVAKIIKNEEKESYTIKNEKSQDEIHISVLGKWGYQGCDYFTPGDYLSLDNQFFYCNQNKETAQLEFVEVTAQNINLLRSLTKNENNHLSLSGALASQGELIRDDNNKIIDFGGGFKNEGLLNHSRLHKLHEKVYFEDLEAAITNNDLKTVVNLTSLIDRKQFNLSIDKLSSLVNGFMDSAKVNPPKYDVSYAEIQATTREGRMYPNEDITFLDKQLETLKKYPYFDVLSTRLSEGLENLKEVYQAIQESHNNGSSRIIDINTESRNNALELFGDFLFHMDDANTNYVLPLLELPNLKPEFQERLDKRFTAAMLPTKAAYVSQMQRMDSQIVKPEHSSSQYLRRETEMLKSCTSSEMLVDLLTELKDSKFTMDTGFQANLLKRVTEDDFKWNMCESSQKYFLEQLRAGEVTEHPPALISHLSGSTTNPEMIISQYIDGEQKSIGTIKKNEDGFTLRIDEAASDLAFAVNGIAKGSDANEISFQPKDFLKIDKKLYYVAKNNVNNRHELLEVSNKAALIEDLFFSHGEIPVSQKSLPECMHLAGIITALSDENGTLIKGIIQGLSPDIDSQERTIYSFRFPAEVKHDAKITGLNTQRIFLKRDSEHGLREVKGSLIPTEIDYEPKGDRDDINRYIRTHSAGAPGVAIISYAITELVRRTDNLYSVLGKGENRVHIEPKMPIKEVGRLLGMESSGSQVSKNAWRAGIEYQEGDLVTINSSFSQDSSVDNKEFIQTLKSYLEDPYYKMTAGSRHKTEEEALKDSGKTAYEDCTWDEKNVFKKEDNGHKIIDHHAVAVSLAENGDFLIHCPHNSLMPVTLSPSEFLDFYDQVNIFRINERRTFMENPLP
jgi:hypothetical protein